jgi:hypothetical protein
VAALASLHPPLLGVVGPVVSSGGSGVGGGRTRVLTHDFVHRTHMDIFNPNYCPPDLTLAGVDMDTWMSRVYGYNRTLVATGVGIIIQQTDPLLNAQQLKTFIPAEKVTALVGTGQQQIISWIKKEYSLRGDEGHSSWVMELESTFLTTDAKKKKLKWIQSYPANKDGAADEEDFDSSDSTGRGSNSHGHSERHKWCVRTKKVYAVTPYLDWGTKISDDKKAIWKEYACNMFFINKKLNKRGVSLCGGGNLNSSLAGTFPLIAVMAATTTRKITHAAVSNIALFTILLPSLVRSLDCGYRYMYVMGYDSGDKFFDTKKVNSLFSCSC